MSNWLHVGQLFSFYIYKKKRLKHILIAGTYPFWSRIQLIIISVSSLVNSVIFGGMQVGSALLRIFLFVFLKKKLYDDMICVKKKKESQQTSHFLLTHSTLLFCFVRNQVQNPNKGIG